MFVSLTLPGYSSASDLSYPQYQWEKALGTELCLAGHTNKPGTASALRPLAYKVLCGLDTPFHHAWALGPL